MQKKSKTLNLSKKLNMYTVISLHWKLLTRTHNRQDKRMSSLSPVQMETLLLLKCISITMQANIYNPYSKCCLFHLKLQTDFGLGTNDVQDVQEDIKGSNEEIVGTKCI